MEPLLKKKMESDKRRKYDKHSVKDLLRGVRNLTGHFEILAPECKTILGPRENLAKFWMKRFPLLLPTVYKAMQPFNKDTNCSCIKHFYEHETL